MGNRVRMLSERDEEIDVPKSIHIRKADQGGFIARKSGGKLGHDDIEIVGTNLKKLLKECGEFLS